MGVGLLMEQHQIQNCIQRLQKDHVRVAQYDDRMLRELEGIEFDEFLLPTATYQKHQGYQVREEEYVDHSIKRLSKQQRTAA